ncbi:hypothetical protein BGZ61DRAFT_587277 [Ilyonectria robusta]|uniref:uncharacterized protein n=1 Tax=Ilyonectria robusta TaxID=1079257 RepID=UPI001E8CF941|nr:uncharacterized protein BGZ61DRAFT_587277 [Ilyonectria robusta]KAH8714545.1 hypothetical protein BGZ61DRAFT_587277 [Ilyonectria robusta]
MAAKFCTASIETVDEMDDYEGFLLGRGSRQTLAPKTERPGNRNEDEINEKGKKCGNHNMSQWDRMDSALVHAEGLFYSELGLFFIQSPGRASHVGCVFRPRVEAKPPVLGQERPLVLGDFLAHVKLVDEPDSIIPEISTLPQLRAHMEVKPILYAAFSATPGLKHSQERFIMIAIVTPLTRGRLLEDFSDTTTICIPG